MTLQIKKPVFLLICILSIAAINSYATNLIGTWKLVSVEKQIKNNRWESDCYSPTGFLIYTANGYMAAGINCMQNDTFKPSFESKDMTFYMGKYTVNKNIVVHQVLNTSNKNLYGKILERKIEIINNNEIYLVLENKNTIRLRWKKIN